ncbi:glycosyltransferase [Waterburya agarophytonicola K14]|uniref:Glycosyltransferase n=1 Tax=Waterburya agarophytonicola KI4 TaxID=2874699 RepID=A0A964BWF1_9CYAN|nr:glycosyltransferase [Waterburya agarophytonicola]MCC0179587.1 glycosyltransferase [Waterburya agarophytonicola KI4]
MSKNILIVEESLRDLKAHWFEYIKTISTAAESDDWQVDVACHLNVADEIKNKLNVFPIFSHAYYLDSNQKQLPGWRYYGFLLHSVRCLKVLFPFLKQQSCYDEIFVPTVLVHHLIAWWAISTFHPHSPKHITLFFVTNPGVWDRETKQVIFPKSSRLQGLLLQGFKKLIEQGKVTFAVETKGAKREFEELTGLPFQLLPHPVPEFDFTPTLCKPIKFACYGFARYEKGSDLLKYAIARLLCQHTDFDAKFSIQWVESFTLPDGSLCQLDKDFCNLPQLEIIDRPLISPDYQSLLQATGCMVLPYRNSSYYARVSRVAIEAVCLGIPVIYTKGGWLEDTLVEFGAGIGIEDENSDELIEAIILMLTNFNDYRQQAIFKQAEAKQYFSGQNFCQMLLKESHSKDQYFQVSQIRSSSV